MPRLPYSSFLFPSGRLIGPESIVSVAGTSTYTPTTNETFTPIVSPISATITDLWVRIVTGVGGATALLGLYAKGSGGNLLGALLASTPAFSVATAGIKIASLSVPYSVVKDEIYWIGFIADTGGVNAQGFVNRQNLLGTTGGLNTGGNLPTGARHSTAFLLVDPGLWGTKDQAISCGIVVP